jgi:enoyl-CoA hydratase
LKLTLRLLRAARRSNSLGECLAREFGAALETAAGHDFPEGVRAAVIDKDRNPKWSPSAIEEVQPEALNPYFAPRTSEETLVLP